MRMSRSVRRILAALLIAAAVSVATPRAADAAQWMSWSELYAVGGDPWYSNWFYTSLSYGGQAFCYALDATTNYQCTYR